MKKHVKIYHDYFDYYYGEFIGCECCGGKAVDIHHLVFRSQLGEDKIENLIALCRDCHNHAHDKRDFNEYLKEVHDNYIKRFTQNKP